MSREFDELLSAYLDGEVSPEERAAVERRLEQSPQLRETLDELSEVGDLIRKLPKARPPVDLPERVVAAISPKPLASTTQPRKRHRLFGAWPMMAAGTVLAAGVAIVVLMPRQPQHVADGLALEPSKSGGAPALAASSPARGLERDRNGGTVIPLAIEPARTAWNDDGAARQSLSEYLVNLGEKPIPGQVLSTLVNDNAGRTHLVRFTVVDSRQVDNKIRTILTNHSFNVVETETAMPQAGIAAAPAASDGFVAYYVEGSRQQVERALDEFGSMAVDGQIEDLGPLPPEPEAARTELFSDTEAKPANAFGLTPQQDKAADQPAATRPLTTEFRYNAPAPVALPKAAAKESAPKDVSDFSAPALVPADPAGAALNGVADGKRADKVELGDRVQVESKTRAFRKAIEQVPAQVSGEAEKLSAPAQAQTSNAYRGVSAQLDSNLPVVQRARSAIQENAVRGYAIPGNALQGNTAQGNSLQRNSLGQTQYNFNRSKSLRSNEDELSRKLNDSVTGERLEKLSEAKGGEGLKQQQSTFGRPAADGTGNLGSMTIANPQSAVAEEERVGLIIFAERAPQPAAPLPAAPAARPEAK